MSISHRSRLLATGAVVVGAALALAGCSSSNPLDEPSSESSSTASGATLSIASQDYYEDETIAEIYAQALENAGYTIDRQGRVGQREAYLSQLTSGDIDIFPEYGGSLLQALDPKTTATTSDDVYAALQKALPDGLNALTPAPASDQNSWTVTQAYADKWNLTDIASLKNVTDPIYVGGNSELQTRPYGPKALESKYGIDIAGFKTVQDSSGPLTVKALVDGDIQLANIYTSDPNISANKLVALDDPDGLFVADNITPIVTDKVDSTARGIIDDIDAKLTQDQLLELNDESVNQQKSAADIAKAWLTDEGLLS